MDLAQMEKYTDKAIELAMGYAPRVVLAILTLVLGFWLAGAVAGAIRRGAEKREVDATLTPFLTSMTTWALRAAVLISVASILGIETTSFVAVLGAAGLAVGLALQGSLSNFAGGALLLIFRPFRVGDVIEAQGVVGKVKEMQIFTTTLLSADRKRIILPNGPVSNGNIINYTAEGIRRVDMVIGVGYEVDLEQVRKLLMDMLLSDDRVLDDPEPSVEVLEHADSSVNLAVRPFTATDDYWPLYFDFMRKSKLALDEAGISIPFPQRDVHLYEHGKASA